MNDLLTLAQAGPAAILLVGIVLLFRAFVRGDIVPGWIYRLEQDQRMKAETVAIRNSEALAALAKAAANGGVKRDAGPSPDA